MSESAIIKGQLWALPCIQESLPVKPFPTDGSVPNPNEMAQTPPRIWWTVPRDAPFCGSGLGPQVARQIAGAAP